MSALASLLNDYTHINSVVGKNLSFSELKVELEKVISILSKLKASQFVDAFKQDQQLFVHPLIKCLAQHHQKLYSSAMSCISKLMMQNLLNKESYQLLLSEMISFLSISDEQFNKNVQVISTILTTPTIVEVLSGTHIIIAISILMNYHETAPTIIKSSTGGIFPIIIQKIFQLSQLEIKDALTLEKGDLVHIKKEWVVTNNMLGLFNDLGELSLGKSANNLNVSSFDKTLCLSLIKTILTDHSQHFIIFEYLESLKSFVNVLIQHLKNRESTLSIAHSIILPLLKYEVKIPFNALLPKQNSEPWEFQSFLTICNSCIHSKPTVDRLTNCTTALHKFLEVVSPIHYPIATTIVSDIISLTTSNDSALISAIWPVTFLLLSVFHDQSVITLCIPLTTLLIKQSLHPALVAIITSLTKVSSYTMFRNNSLNLFIQYPIFKEEELQALVPILGAVSNLSPMPTQLKDFPNFPRTVIGDLSIESSKLLISAFQRSTGLSLNSGSIYYAREYLEILVNCKHLDDVIPSNTETILKMASSDSEASNLVPPFLTRLFRTSPRLVVFKLCSELLSSQSLKCISNTLDILYSVVDGINPQLQGHHKLLLEPLGECSKHKSVVGSGFNVVKQIGSYIGSMNMDDSIEVVIVVGKYATQENDVNVSLSAIQLLWDLLEGVTGDNKTDSGLSEKDVLMLTILRIMKQTISDSRYDVWSGTVQTLLRALGNVANVLSINGWEQAMEQILIPILQEIRTNIYCRLADVQMVPDVNKSSVKINSYLTPVMRQWNDVVVVVLSGLTRLIPTFNNLNKQIKQTVFEQLLKFSTVAFFKPTFTTVEAILKFTNTLFLNIHSNEQHDSSNYQKFKHYKMKKLKSLFINTFITFNCNPLKLLNVYPDDHYLIDNMWSPVQQKILNGLQSIHIHDVIKQNEFDMLQQEVIKTIDTFLTLSTDNTRKDDSKWCCLPKLIQIALDWNLEIWNSITEVEQKIIPFIGKEVTTQYSPLKTLTDIQHNLFIKIENGNGWDVVNAVQWVKGNNFTKDQRVALVEIILDNCHFYDIALKQSISAYESILVLLDVNDICDIIVEKLWDSLHLCFERFNEKVESSVREVCFVMDDVFSVLIAKYKDDFPNGHSFITFQNIYSLTINTISSSNIEVRISALAVMKSLYPVLLQQ
ncbi:Mon2/Sec7/BIG1-like dimerization and cyclophilin-binding domain-containing protein [Entamoeba marina]